MFFTENHDVNSSYDALQVAMSKFDKVPLPYEKLAQTLEVVKKRLGRDMTLSEKVLYSHLDDPKAQVSFSFTLSYIH